jgi:hypothetical protein
LANSSPVSSYCPAFPTWHTWPFANTRI